MFQSLPADPLAYRPVCCGCLKRQIAQTGEGIEQFACLNFAICFVLVFSPMIVSGLVAGGNRQPRPLPDLWP